MIRVPGRPVRWSEIRPDAKLLIATNRLRLTLQRSTDTASAALERLNAIDVKRRAQLRADRDARLARR